MKSKSLRLRLLLGAGVAVFVTLLVAWLAMTWLFARHIERTAWRDMSSDGKQLLAELSIGADGAPLIEEPLRDPRYDLPASGRYWQLTSPAGNTRSRSLWDSTLPPAANDMPSRWNTRYADGPNGKRVFLVERRVQPDANGPQVLIQVANDEDELRETRARFGLELAAFLTLLWIALLLAAWLQVRLGLRPLGRIRDDLASLRRNPSARLDAADHAQEILPLTEAINALADTREKDLARARRRAADLAHSLKTPLSAMRAQSRAARQAGAVDAADALDRVIAAAASAVESELARSRAADIRARDTVAESNASEVAERVVGVVERTERGGALVFDVDIDPALRLPIAADDLMELLGALIENAARFAKRRVRVAASHDAASIELRVEDDGAGLDIDAEQALARGGRLDEAAHAHHGLGLSIVRELVDATGGEMQLQRSPLGGLLVVMRWINS